MSQDVHTTEDTHALPLSPAKTHVIPLPMLFAVWVFLCGLAVVSTLVAAANIGSMNVLVEMIIASVMSIVAALYFMHLLYDNPFNIAAMLLTLIFITLFISLSLTDTTDYRSELIPGYAPAMQNAAKVAAQSAKSATAVKSATATKSAPAGAK